MAAESRSLATALWAARFASRFLPASYTTRGDTIFKSVRGDNDKARRQRTDLKPD
ncbi:hypothetical protein GGD83_005014 [Rhodoblastus sphagnicola]|uniref:hypothetical protein n=1 Tax=Rhodoblastus sphagnicola TaxID=333368 RepID=UPI001304C480|nr:hypothetical protein [Rhodoblastus sphagnicola]MBB4201176.1 hypothetical protein [Rhodoblastus sphagnicola]